MWRDWMGNDVIPTASSHRRPFAALRPKALPNRPYGASQYVLALRFTARRGRPAFACTAFNPPSVFAAERPRALKEIGAFVLTLAARLENHPNLTDCGANLGNYDAPQTLSVELCTPCQRIE
jgi:hypothetical protein